MRTALSLIIGFWLLVASVSSAAAEMPVIEIAALKFGSVNWELDVIKTHGLDRMHGFRLEVVDIAGKQAADIMLLGGEVDVITTDWIWVSRQRSAGADLLSYHFRVRSGP